MSRTDTAVRVIPPLRPTERPMSRSASRCDHRRRGPNLCRPTLEPFDRGQDHTVSTAGLETRRRPAPTEPPNGAQQLRLIHGRVLNEDPLTGHRFFSCRKGNRPSPRYLAVALDEEQKQKPLCSGRLGCARRSSVGGATLPPDAARVNAPGTRREARLPCGAETAALHGKERSSTWRSGS
jgi:hypothetical protein